MRAASYTRLSFDPNGDKDACERQEADIAEHCKRQGWELVAKYRDNDVSAYDKRKKRPEFERMLGDIHSGLIDVVVIWKSDRLARQPRDLERFLDVCERRGVTLTSLTEPEFSGSSGLLILRLLVAFGSHESGVKSERVAAAYRHKAGRGEYNGGGRRQYGYTRAGEIVPEEAAVLRDAVTKLLAGESAASIMRQLKAEERGEWRSSANFLRMFRSPRIGGLQVYRGQIVGEGKWEPIIDHVVWKKLQVVLDERRKQRRKAVKRYMLTGILRCGRCGSRLSGTFHQAAGQPVYRCLKAPPYNGCGGVQAMAARVEAVVTERVLTALSGPLMDKLLEKAPKEDRTTELLETLHQDEAALEQASKDHYVERAISRPEFLAVRRGLEDRIQATKQELAKSKSGILQGAPRAAEALRAEWERRDPDWRRTLIETVAECIELMPPKRRGHWSDDRVKITWKA